LALLALAIQFALSFGHLHFHGSRQGSTAAPFVLGWTVQLSTASPQGPAGPAQHTPDGAAGDSCAICSVMQLAASAVPAAAPALPLLEAVGRTSLDATVAFTLAASPHILFQARAPPHA
jgi:hypothetical protein